MLTATQSKALDTVMASYVIPDPDDVRAFLEERPRVAEVLVEALDVIPEYFKGGNPIILRIRFDPEGEEPPYAAAYIHTSSEPTTTIDTMRRLWLDWFGALPRDVREEILFSPEPISS